MKKLFSVILFLVISPSYAQTRVFNLDSIDAVVSENQEFKIEDLRDGFETVNGITVTDDSVIVNENTNATLNFRNSFSSHSKITIQSAIKIGGGDGGGG